MIDKFDSSATSPLGRTFRLGADSTSKAGFRLYFSPPLSQAKKKILEDLFRSEVLKMPRKNFRDVLKF